MNRVLIAMMLFAAAQSRAHEIVSPAPSDVRITIYRDSQTDEEDDYDDLTTGLAMVSETRTVEVPEGESTLVLRGVAHVIVPQTVALEGMPGIVLESNYDYDLLNPGAIVAKSIGHTVRLVRTDRATGRTTEERGILKSGPYGIVLDIGGRIEALGCSGLAEKLVFDDIPNGLTETPTLSMKVRVEHAGRYTLRLSYLSLGLNWAADYVATINPDGRTLDLTGWITLINHTGTTFENAPTEVIAGELERTREETQAPEVDAYQEQMKCWPVGSFATQRIVAEDIGKFPDRSVAEALQRIPGDRLEDIVVTGMRAPIAQMSELGDYKLYRAPEPTTVAARQSKQVLFLDQHQIPFERFYTYRVASQDVDSEELSHSPIATLRLQNKERDHLGKPLPAGTMSVFETGTTVQGKVLAGEKTLKDTPVGLPLEVELGQAMDIWVEPRLVEERTIDHQDDNPDEREAKIEVRFANDKPIPVSIEYRHPMQQDLRVVRESKRHTTKDDDLLWEMAMKPGERAVLTYTVRATD